MSLSSKVIAFKERVVGPSDFQLVSTTDNNLICDWNLKLQGVGDSLGLSL